MKKLLLTLAIFIFLPTTVSAQKYLIDLPIATQTDFNTYINLLYKMSISIAALLAVVKIVIAGGKYMLTDVVTTKGEAKDDIKGALLGLLLILGAVIFLNTINPALTDGGLNITRIDVPELDISAPSVRTVDGQTADERATELAAVVGDACAVPAGTVIAPSGTRSTARINISTCTSKTLAISAIRKECLKTVGASFAVGTDQAWVQCATPIDTGREYVNSGLDNGDYSTINQDFVRTEANKRIVNVTGQCDQEHPEGGFNRNNCISQGKSVIEDYCVDDNGGNYTDNGDDVECLLPIRRAYLSTLDDELAQHLASPEGSEIRVGVGGSVPTDANDIPFGNARVVCQIWGGEFRNLDGDKNICVDFDSDPSN